MITSSQRRWAVVLFTVMAGCEQQGVVTPPTAAEVEAVIEAGYREPARHSVTVSPHDVGRGTDQVIVWARQFDGVDLLTDARSARVGDRWETRFLRELSEPEAVRRAEVVPFDRAARAVGLEANKVRARLAYRPELEQLKKVAEPKNAADVEMVVRRYRLVIELADDEAKANTYVDAYTGEKIETLSQWVHSTIQVPTQKYGTVAIEATPPPMIGPKLLGPYTFKDPLRTSLLSELNKPINGQGLASGTPTNLLTSIGYQAVPKTADYANDIAFGLKSAWDYFSEKHGRRGLRGLLPSEKATANDAIVYMASTPNYTNLAMHSDTGLIELDQDPNNPIWQNWVTVDVLGHEWTHAVWAADTLHWDITYYWGSNGGLNEANSDLFGEMIEARALAILNAQRSPDVIADGWVYGQDAGPTSPGAASTLRYMCTPSQSPSQNLKDVWSAAVEDPVTKMDAHDAAGPLDRVFCLLGRGMVPNGSANDPELQSQWVPNGFAALGARAVARLQYATLLYLRGYPLPASYMDERSAMLSAATVLYGEYSPEYKAVQDAFAAINVGTPADRGPPPKVTLTSGLVLGQTKPITVDIVASNPMKAVTFQLGTTILGTVTSEPWQITPPAFPEGTYTLYVYATDVHLNSTTATYNVLFDGTAPSVTMTDVTPCAPKTWCGAYQHKRVYRVAATDYSAISMLRLYVDGPPVQAAAGNSYDFTVSYTVGGQHTLRASATDAAGNGSATPWTTFDIDLTPPTFNQGPTATPDYTSNPSNPVEGRVWFQFCATDPSGVMPTPWVELDGAEYSTSKTDLYNGCFKLMADHVSIGTHAWKVHEKDTWGNDAASGGSLNLVAVPPQLATPTVSVASTPIGNITVSTSYSATNGIASLNLAICTSGGCVWQTPFHPTTAADQTAHTFSVSGLTAGHSYWAQVSVVGKNGLSTQKNSAGFTIPTGQQPTVYNEVERNDEYNNMIPSNTSQIKGKYNGTPLAPLTGYWDYDGFAISVPAGKTLHVTSSFNCPNVEIVINAWDPQENSWSPWSGELADGSVSMSDQAWPVSVAPSTTFEIGVNFNKNNYTGWSSPTTAGCASTSYTLNVSVTN